MATPGLLKIKIAWNRGCDLIIFVHDITNKYLLRESSYIVDVVMRLNFGNSKISRK